MTRQVNLEGLSKMTGISETRLREILNLNKLQPIEVFNLNSKITKYSRYDEKAAGTNIYG